MKRNLTLFGILIVFVLIFTSAAGCAQYDKFTLNGWEKIALDRMGKTANEVDLTKLRVEDFIDLSGLTDKTYLYTDGEDKTVNKEGWYATLIDDFDVTYDGNSGLNSQVWTTSRHDVRWASQSKSHPEYANYW